MANKSTYLANAQLNAAVKNTALQMPATFYVALFSVAPTAGGGGTELSGGGYTRLAVATSSWGSPSSGSVSNTSALTFAQSTGSQGTAVAWAMFDASTSGNMWYFGNLLGTNDVQTLSISGSPTGGTFTLNTPGSGVSLAIPYNATAEEVYGALVGQAGGTDLNLNVSYSGGPLPSSAVVLTFINSLGSQSVTLMTVAANNLTGGSSPTPSVAHTTTGNTGNQTIGINNTFQFPVSDLTITES